MTRRLGAVLLLSLLPLISRAQGIRQQDQSITLPTFTADQNWARATTLMNALGTGGFAWAKKHGATAVSYGRDVGESYAPGWGARDGGSAIRYARGIHNNLRAISGAAIDFLTVHDTFVVMRVARVWRSYFGPTQIANGVTLAENDTISAEFQTTIAKYLGLHFKYQIDSAYLTYTISGRGKSAVLDFPRGTFTAAYTSAMMPIPPEMAGSWEVTFAPSGRYTVRRDGALFVEGDYQVRFDELWQSNETLPTGPGCANPSKYRWTVNPTTGALTFGRLSDDCDGRIQFYARRTLTMKK